jgi:Flp pilus assembly protein TadG
MKYRRKISFNNRGIVVILLALGILVLLLAFTSLAVDISYMYNVKNGLQVSADASALAGAALIADVHDLAQSAARNEALAYASKNTAAGTSVQLASDGSNVLSPDNDITVGNWDSAKGTYSRDKTPVNAMEVRPRRTSDSPGGQVSVFWGQILSFFGQDWSLMSASAHAIAAIPARAKAPIAICFQSCSPPVPVDPDHPLTLYWAPYPAEADPGYQGIAWTIFSPSPAMDSSLAISFFCGNDVDACNLPPVATTNGSVNAVQRQFRCALKNPLYDSGEKTCADGTCDSAGDVVTSWKVLIPYFSEDDGCPPGAQPHPYTVAGYAEVTIAEVYASGAGGNNECACGAFDAPPLTGSYPNGIVVTGIVCASCDDSPFLGEHAILVK